MPSLILILFINCFFNIKSQILFIFVLIFGSNNCNPMMVVEKK